MTERAEYMFTVKEYSGGTPWIALEPCNSHLQILSKGFLGFDLPPNTSYEKACEIKDYLNDNIDKVSYTKTE